MEKYINTWIPSKPCTICRSWQGEIKAIADGISVIRCKSCGLYYIDSQPLGSLTEEKLARTAIIKGEEYLDEIYNKKQEKWLQYYRNTLKKIQNKNSGYTLLDIGCGVGYLVKVACETGWDAFGIDTSKDDIIYGQSHLNLKDRLFFGNLKEHNFDSKFDVITLFSVIEHIDDPYQFLLEISNCLNPGGVILIKTPSQSSLITKLSWMTFFISRGKFFPRVYNREHIYRFTPMTLSLLVRKLGYTILESTFDDELWITSTRYLFEKNYKIIRYLVLAGVFWASKLIRMPNQILMIARKSEI